MGLKDEEKSVSKTVKSDATRTFSDLISPWPTYHLVS